MIKPVDIIISTNSGNTSYEVNIMDANLQSSDRYPEGAKTKPNRTGLGSAKGYVEFVESQAKENNPPK